MTVGGSFTLSAGFIDVLMSKCES